MPKDPKIGDAYNAQLKELEKSLGASSVLYKDLVHRAGELADLTEDSVKFLEDQLDIGSQLGQNQKDIFSAKIDTLSIEKKLATATGKEKVSLQDALDLAKQQVKYQDMAVTAMDKYNKKTKGIKKIAGMIPGIGSDLVGIMDKAGDAYKKELGEGFDPKKPESMAKKGAASFKAVGAAALAAGLIIGKKVLGAMQQTGLSIGDIFSRPEFLLFGAEANAIANEFGNMDSSSVKLAGSMKLTAILTGVTAENQAKIMGMMAATSDSSLTALKAQMMSYQKAGVPFKAIMDDVAGNTEHFAKFAKDGGANIFEAAAKAKELGVNLGDVASISNSLLQFESSIEAQMNAQVLLGKNLNLDKARQLAFTGDQAGMMEEIVNQVGGEAEFNKMNVIQRQALADSVGLTVEKMGALVRAEEQNAAAADKSKQKYKVMGAVILGIIGAVLGGLAFFTGGTSLLGIAAMAGGGIAGSAIGYGLGGAVGLAKGGIVSGPTSAVVGEAGPEAVVPLPAQGVKMDLKPMVNKMDELIAINRRMIDEIVNLQVG
jgi:hypothetical protein